MRSYLCAPSSQNLTAVGRYREVRLVDFVFSGQLGVDVQKWEARERGVHVESHVELVVAVVLSLRYVSRINSALGKNGFVTGAMALCKSAFLPLSISSDSCNSGPSRLDIDVRALSGNRRLK